MKIIAIIAFIVTILSTIQNILESILDGSILGVFFWGVIVIAWSIGLFMFIYWFDVIEK